MLADAPHPNAAYAWLNFIRSPRSRARRRTTTCPTPNDAAKEFVDPKILANTAVFPPDDVIKNLEGSKDTSGDTQRNDIYAEFKQAIRRLSIG